MRLLAVDLGWAPSTRRVAAAWCTGHGLVRWGCPPVSGHAELVRWIADWAGGNCTPGGTQPGIRRVGLDIPLSVPATGAFRTVERQLSSLGLFPLPSHKAGRWGQEMAQALHRQAGLAPSEVLEVFPFAVYKVLDWLRTRPGGLAALAAHIPLEFDWPAALRRYRHHKYKHAAGDERRAALNSLADLLQEPGLGWRFPMPLPRPGDLSLDRLTDLYDALLALLPMWLRFARSHPWARPIGQVGEEILILLPT